MADQKDRGDGHTFCTDCGAFAREHFSHCSELRPFPIQNGGKIPWWLAKIAYEQYHHRWPGQSLEELAERGGFGIDELLMFIRREE